VIVLRKKFALTGAAEASITPTPFRWKKLGADYAFEVDCTNRDLLDRKFVKGFAVIQAPVDIDVVAVYTAGSAMRTPDSGADSLQTMEIERVPPRPMMPVAIP
jgi:hypothetical protein